jgi:hypothetical protein
LNPLSDFGGATGVQPGRGDAAGIHFQAPASAWFFCPQLSRINGQKPVAR